LDLEGSESESRFQNRARPRRDRRTAALWLLPALLACRAYEPAPLDDAAHRDAWLARAHDASAADSAGDDSGAEGVALLDGLALALAHRPDLRAARARAGISAAGAAEAGRLDDPELSWSALRITEDVDDRWVLSGGLAFTIPLGDRRDAEKDLAAAERRAAALAAAELEWDAVHDVELAWLAWTAARLRADESERLVRVLGELAAQAAELSQQGELSADEAALFEVERALERSRSIGLVGEADAAAIELRAALGLAPDADLRPVPSLGLERAPLGAPSGAAAMHTDAAARHPLVARLRAEYDAAEQRLRREIARTRPDLTLGPQLEDDEGQARIGLFGGLPLPIWNANRRAIAEASAARAAARIAFEAGLEQVVAQRAAGEARAAAQREQRVELERVVTPLVDRRAAEATRLFGLGESTGLVLLASARSAHDAKLAWIDARAAEASARVEVERWTGPAPAEGDEE